MKKRKSIFTFIIVSIIISILTGTAVSARNLYINTATTTLTISSSGTATITGNVSGYQGSTTQMKIHLELQQYKNNSWQAVPSASWSETFNTHRGTLSKTFNVEKGYNYRIKATY